MKSISLKVLYCSSVKTHFFYFFLVFSFVFLLKIVIRIFFSIYLFIDVMLPALYISNISPALLPVTQVFLFPIQQR